MLERKLTQQPSEGTSEEHKNTLRAEVERLRRKLDWKPEQLDKIHKLYARHVAIGQLFPPDLEEHSLWLILKFVRPDDDRMARRLVSVLQAQGKPVPDELRLFAWRGILTPPEQMALDKRRRTAAGVARASMRPLHERVSFVMGLPKSASRLLVSVLAAMHPDQRYRKAAALPYSTGYVGVDATADLRHEALEQFTDGGIVHSHGGATFATRYSLGSLALGHVITVRHPADHVAALYCHIRRIAKILPPDVIQPVQDRNDAGPLPTPASADGNFVDGNGFSRLYFHPVIFPVDPLYFLPSIEVDDAIAHLIAGGYLHHALSWILDWQVLRVRNISSLVRYEDFIERPEQVLTHLNDVLFGGYSDEGLQRGLKVLAEKSYDQNPDPDIYPRGSTGAIGIWGSYLSPENRKLYNSVCRKFIAAHPHGYLLDEMYDDLIIDIEERPVTAQEAQKE